MSSIIRWRKAETLRTVGMGYPNDVVLLMASNGIGKLHRKTGWSSFPHTIKNGCAERLRATEFPRSGLVQSTLCNIPDYASSINPKLLGALLAPVLSTVSDQPYSR